MSAATYLPVPFVECLDIDSNLDERCYLCRRPVHPGHQEVEIVHGGGEWVAWGETTEDERNDAGYMGMQPIGSECWKKLVKQRDAYAQKAKP